MTEEMTPEQEIELIKTDIKENFKDLSSETTIGLLKRFKLMTETELNEDVSQDKETKVFTPPLRKGQVVQVRFIGQGTALNGKHFALIWNVNTTEGQVVVLPMSSKKKKNQGMYDLGPIEGLRSPINLVLFQQSHTVPRESIHIWTKRIKNNQTGEFDNVPIELNEFQLKHMESVFRHTHLKEKDMFCKICFETGNKVPEFVPDELLMHINKHLKIKVESEKIIYKLPHETQFKEFPLVNIAINTKTRFRLLAGLLSSDQILRTSTQKKIHDLLTTESHKE